MCSRWEDIAIIFLAPFSVRRPPQEKKRKRRSFWPRKSALVLRSQIRIYKHFVLPYLPFRNPIEEVRRVVIVALLRNIHVLVLPASTLLLHQTLIINFEFCLLREIGQEERGGRQHQHVNIS